MTANPNASLIADQSPNSLLERRSAHFCRAPFEKVEVMANGDIYLCCPGWLKTSIGNLLQTPLLELWNGETARAIRESVLNGSFKYCDASMCPHLQALDSGTKPAIYSPIESLKRPSSSYAETLAAGTVPKGPREIAVGFDLTCNLSCPSCRREPIIFRPGTTAWQQADKMATDVIGAYPLLRRLKLAGNGDPFASRIYGRMLNALDSEKFPNLRVTLHTNGLLFTPDRWKELQKGQASIDTVEVSVDAASGETYALNRRGGSFETLVERLEFIGKLRAEKKLQRLLVSFIVQTNNFHEMREFVELGRRVHADTIIFSRLNDWGTFPHAVLTARSIHRADHPRHQELLTQLSDPVFDSRDVFLGNLSLLRSAKAASSPAV